MLQYWKCFLSVGVSCADSLLHLLIPKILLIFFLGGEAVGREGLPAFLPRPLLVGRLFLMMFLYLLSVKFLLTLC